MSLMFFHHPLLLFFGGIFFLIPAIFYLLTLQNALGKCAPVSRTMEPGMVWLSIIPLFSVIWNFFVVMALAKSLGNEFRLRGIPYPDPLPGQSIGMAMCICGACGLIPIVNFFAGPVAFILWIVYWLRIAEFSRMLNFPTVAIPAPPAY